jgi:hypothetical protein
MHSKKKGAVLVASLLEQRHAMKKTSCALIAGVSLMLAGAAHAGTIDFDDANTDGDFASLADISPYAGMKWSADWYAGDNTIDGYANGAHSGANYAINGIGSDDMTISSATAAAQLPGPGSQPMLAIGLLALGAGRHQARRPSTRTLLRLAA